MLIRACVGPSNDAMRTHTGVHSLNTHTAAKGRRARSSSFWHLRVNAGLDTGEGSEVRDGGRIGSWAELRRSALTSLFSLITSFHSSAPVSFPRFASPPPSPPPLLPLLQAASPPHPASYMNEASKNKSSDWGEEGGPGNPRGVRLSQWPSVLLQLANMLITADTRLFLHGAVR